MKAFLIAGAIAVQAATAAQAAEVTDTQVTAALVEWTLAHCGMDKVPAATAMFVPMVVNGSEPGEMDEARQRVRERIAGQFATREAACASLSAHFSAASPDGK